MSSKELLTVKDLKTYFFTASGVSKAVDGVSFTLNKGETMGIVGESGSGKSVTASSIIRLLPKIGKIVEGEIHFDGKDILKLNKNELLNYRGRDIAVVFQDPMTSLDPVFKIGNQMVEMICAHQDVTREEAKQKAIDALKKVGIPQPEKRMESYPYELSGGMCQRVIIAMAVCCKPKMIIADEPTTALDVTIQAQILELMKEIRNELNTSIILITHDLGVVADICDKVNVMYGGIIIESATIREIFYNQRHPYTWGLLESIPSASDTKKKLVPIDGQPPDLLKPPVGCPFYGRCKYAMKICKENRPKLYTISESHKAACWLNDERAPKVETPVERRDLNE